MNLSKKYLKLTLREGDIIKKIIQGRKSHGIDRSSVEDLSGIYRFKDFTHLNSWNGIEALFPDDVFDIYNEVLDSNIGKSIISHTEKSKSEIKFMEYYFLFALPLTNYIHQLHNKDKTPLIFGFQAPQSCGKTTVCNIVEKLSREYFNLNVRSISSDDLYYPYEVLQEIKSKDPRFKFRGPPGTHDIQKGMKILKNVKERKGNYFLPSFAKNLRNGLGDVMPDSDKNYVQKPIDVLIFEGWFNGIKPVDDSVLKSQCKDERLLEFQMKVRDNLRDYQCLWDMFDSLLIITPERYELSKEWRIRTEKVSGKLKDNEIHDFVDYFWKTIPPTIYFNNLLESVKGNQNVLSLKIDENMDYYML